jgi:2'-5' RNA ligase
MTTYLELKVPIHFEEPWFRELRDLLHDVNVRWQKGFYHITLAFLDYAPDHINLVPGIDEFLGDATAPTIDLDRLDAFTTGGGHKQVIYLTTTQIPEDFATLVQDIRQHLMSMGCRIQSAFKLHVTLGRVQDPRTNLHQLKEIISQVELPDINLDLTEVDYRIFKDYGKPLAHWTLSSY